MDPVSRRRFLRGATGAAALVGAPSIGAAGDSPSETVRVAVLGGGRGRALALWFTLAKHGEVVAVCDPDASRRRGLRSQVESESKKRPEEVVDFRSILDRGDVDAIAVATPDHWHAPATILACLAGKDVYVEKPASHNIVEGRLAIKAARKHDRIVQHGTQLRSAPHYREAWKLISDGVIGDVKMVKAINNQRRGRMGHRKDEPTPTGVDYDVWQGPVKRRPFNRNRFLHGWHWLWEYGTGDIGNDGVHQIDIGRWALGLGAPKAVSCSAAKLGSKGDAQETPDTMVVTWEYDDLLYVFEQRDFTPYRQLGHRFDNDNIFFGDKGFLMIDREGYRVFIGNQPGPASGTKWRDSGAHYQNFIDCVRSRRREDLIAEIADGHVSALMCHLGNIAHRTGRRLRFDPRTETFVGDAAANRFLGREYAKGFELPRV